MEIEISINNLTNVCLCNIFKFFSLSERWIASQVNKHWSKIDLMSHESINTLDTSDKRWHDLFYDLIDQRRQFLMEEILNKYGQFIKHLKYDYFHLSPLIHTFSLDKVIDACPNLRNLILLRGTRPCHLDKIMKKYKNIVEFRLRPCVAYSDDTLYELFNNNKNLKYVEMTIWDDRCSFFNLLKERPIEELIICTSSKETMDCFVNVLAHLTRLKILRIECLLKMDTVRLMRAMSRCTNLERITIHMSWMTDTLSPTLLQLDRLIELNLPNQNIVTDKFLSHIGVYLHGLQSLNIAECTNVTDKGLNTLSNLQDLSTLNIDNLTKINGEGLLDFDNLKSLSCRYSTIFDTPLCYMIRSCEKLRFLNIEYCLNVTGRTIDTAIRIISQRNTTILQIFVNVELMNYISNKAPPLLEFICTGSLPLNEFTQKIYIIDRSIGKAYNSIQRSILFLEALELPNDQILCLKHYCMGRVLQFLSIPKRMKMRRVSKYWGELINNLWYTVKTLNLSTPEWKYILFDKRTKDIMFVLKKVLKICGKYVVNLSLPTRFPTHIIMNMCPNLKTLISCYNPLYTLDITLMAYFYANLTELSLLLATVDDKALSRLFETNRHLKSITLHGHIKTRFDFLLRTDPLFMESLNLYWVLSDPDSVRTQFNLATALSKFVNLKNLTIVGGLFRSDRVVEAIRECKKLTTLKLQSNYLEQITGDLNYIKELTELEILSLPSFSQIIDSLLADLSCCCKKLVHVDISDCQQVTDVGLRSITSLTNLNTLIINRIRDIDGTGLNELSGSTFRRLECQECYSINTEPICEILLNCSHLEFLNVTDCKKVDRRIVDIAFEVTNDRTNNVLLRILAHVNLIRVERGIAPPLLELLISSDFNNVQHFLYNK